MPGRSPDSRHHPSSARLTLSLALPRRTRSCDIVMNGRNAAQITTTAAALPTEIAAKARWGSIVRSTLVLSGLALAREWINDLPIAPSADIRLEIRSNIWGPALLVSPSPNFAPPDESGPPMSAEYGRLGKWPLHSRAIVPVHWRIRSVSTGNEQQACCFLLALGCRAQSSPDGLKQPVAGATVVAVSQRE